MKVDNKPKNRGPEKSDREQMRAETDADIDGGNTGDEDMIARVHPIAAPLCEAEGMELVHVEFRHEAGRLILRVYIDKEGGVNLEDCTLISRQLNDLLDVHMTDSVPYNLEVSSPGLDRPLSKPHDFQRFKGETVKIKTFRPVAGRKNFKGILLGISGGIVQMMVDHQSFAIPHEGIMRARLVNKNGDSKCL